MMQIFEELQDLTSTKKYWSRSKREFVIKELGEATLTRN